MRPLLLTLALLFVLVSGCSAQDKAPAQPAPTDTTAVNETPANDSTVYVDVRTPEEYQAGHIRGAVFIPHDQIPQRLNELEVYKDKKVVLYCRSGRRAGLVLDTLKANGFTRVENGGGFEALKAAGVPTAK